MTDFFFVLFFSLFRSKNPIRQRWKVWEVPGTGTIAIGETMETIGWRWSVSFLFFFQETKKHRYYYCCCCLAHCQTGRKLADSKGWSCGDAKNKKGKTDADPHTHTHTHTRQKQKKSQKKTRKKKKWGNETRQQDASYDKPADTFCIFHQKENERERERERDKLPFSASRLSRRRPVQGVSLFLAGHVLFYFFLGNRFHFFLCVLRRLISFVGGSSPDSSTGRTNSTEKDPLLLLSLLLLLLSCSTRSSMRLTACKCWLTPNRNREQRWDRSNSGVLLGFSWFYWVLLGFTEFFTGGCKVLKEVVCEWLLLGFTWFFWIASRLEPIQSLFFSKSKQNQKENVSPSRMTMRDRSFVGI